MNDLIKFNEEVCLKNNCCPLKVLDIFKNEKYQDFFSYTNQEGKIEFIINKQVLRTFFYQETGFILSFSNKARETRKDFLQKMAKNKVAFSIIDMHDFLIHVLPFFHNAPLYKIMLCEKFSKEADLTRKAVLWEMMGAFMSSSVFAKKDLEYFGMFVWRHNEQGYILKKFFAKNNKQIKVDEDYQEHRIAVEDNSDTQKQIKAFADLSDKYFNQYLDFYNNTIVNVQ